MENVTQFLEKVLSFTHDFHQTDVLVSAAKSLPIMYRD